MFTFIELAVRSEFFTQSSMRIMFWCMIFRNYVGASYLLARGGDRYVEAEVGYPWNILGDSQGEYDLYHSVWADWLASVIPV